uniref:Aminotransferase class III-fold pyridoxal phosphate-dependent enzyme n=1 Tax=Agrobacterium albertimagni TaxID=147266 RepID=A0A7C1SW38_9HYPH
MTASESETQARLLAQALPFMQRYENKTIVVKYGGHAMGNPELGKAFAADIALLKQSGVNPIVVHGGGPQIGAMLAREEVAKALGPGTHASTFGGTPFVTSVALATLTTVIEERIPERAARMGSYLMAGLRALAARHAAIREVRGRGLLIGVELDRPAAPVVDACREAGLLVLTAGERVLRLTPPLIVAEADCDRALEVVDRALGEVAR